MRKLFGAALLAACGSPSSPSWEIVARHLPSAVLSVWGASDHDVYLVGSDANDGLGPLVEHFDGKAWTRLSTGQIGDLWWVFGFDGGPIYMSGAGGMILRYDGTSFVRTTTPGQGIVFGLWGSSPTDMWAVGGNQGGASGAFAWRLQGNTWTSAPGFPTDLDNDAIWKNFGRSAQDMWMVGTRGKTVQWDGTKLTEVSANVGESLFTVAADARGYVAVGGFGTGLILENDGSGWQNESPMSAPGLIGVNLSPHGNFVVGQMGAVYARVGTTWQAEDTGLDLYESLHSVWVDPSGGVWSVGGEVLTVPLDDGIVLHKGASVPMGIQ